MLKHVIWDWNGTLLDDVDACVGAINRMLAPRHLPMIDRDMYRRVFDFPVIRYYERLGFNLAEEDWDAVAVEFHGHYGELARGARLRAGVADVLQGLSRAAIPMSVLSACETSILARMLSEHGIADRFVHVFGLDNLQAASKLDLGKVLVRDLALLPGEMVLIGDTNHDHDVAIALGIRCVLMTGGHQHEDRLRATEILPSPSDLLSRLLTDTAQ